MELCEINVYVLDTGGTMTPDGDNYVTVHYDESHFHVRQLLAYCDIYAVVNAIISASLKQSAQGSCL